MWVLLHSGHNHSESAEASSAALGPEVTILGVVVLLVVGLVAAYVGRRYL
ncbi:hypothetical protein GRX03_01335 [Halovenus sp. WSH3]|uniref:LPXTG cell wall anchor domain-containing protein n=1 Tax=Halovenus carboxidivorans TaxID=2692199 RepID=A0A6B0SXJ9_9EURY|nr:hypothetical protein [Halovenus carboxidivorans]MXR50254.1 hypothetical protein [Halovenus carboxidivorans]